MSRITDQWRKIQETIPAGVRLVAVSKTKPAEAIAELYEAGQRLFGENRVQELVDKQLALPSDIAWHAIGHLQTNKVKYIAPFVSLIHGVESLRLLETIHRQGEKCGRVIPCLLEFHIAREESKFGLNPEEAMAILEDPLYRTLTHVRIDGVMGMATYTDNLTQVREEFASLRRIFGELQRHYFAGAAHFCEVSMGMSGDYRIAIEEGSTLVRVGSSIFS